MSVTPTGLTRAAGVAAAIAGVIFVAVQVNHPPMEVSSVETTEWVVRNTAKVVMAACALAGITGMYLRQVRESGIPGLIGYLLFCCGYLVMLSVAFVAAYVLPSLAANVPDYVDDMLVAAAGGTATDEIGLMKGAFVASAIGYLAGGFIFGVAMFRANVLARWASALLAVGTLATIALPALPQSFERPFAVPTGVALIGLGISLWRNPRARTDHAAPATLDLTEQPAVR